MRQIVLDTETTGLEASEGHRIIEIGCVELVERRITRNSFHQYCNPGRAVEEGALQVHGIDNRFLANKPRFAEIVPEFFKFVDGAELLIHNAAFDVGFINNELKLMGEGAADITARCRVVDTLELARRLHPGQKNSLDALCKRYHVDNSGREYHGALLDAQLLAEVYLAMTGGQAALSLDAGAQTGGFGHRQQRRLNRDGITLTVTRATAEESEAHEARLAEIDKVSGGHGVWTGLDRKS